MVGAIARNAAHSVCQSALGRSIDTSSLNREAKWPKPPGSAIFHAAMWPTSTSLTKSFSFQNYRGPFTPKISTHRSAQCFGLKYDDVEADVRDGKPTRIRELLAKSKTPEARCTALAADGQCCMGTVQELFVKLRGQA